MYSKLSTASLSALQTKHLQSLYSFFYFLRNCLCLYYGNADEYIIFINTTSFKPQNGIVELILIPNKDFVDLFTFVVFLI